MRVTPLGLYLRVIVNEKPLNFEKTLISVLSVLLLIYDFIIDIYMNNINSKERNKMFLYPLNIGSKK